MIAVELLAILATLKITTRSVKSSLKLANWQWGTIAGMSVGLGFIAKGFMIFVSIVALIPYLLDKNEKQ